MAFRGTKKRFNNIIKAVTPLLVLISIFISGFPSIAQAQVQTRLRVIEASNVGSAIDPSLRDIHDQLGSLFRYTSYRLIRDDTFALSPNRTTSIAFQEGRSIEVTQIGLQKNIAELRVRITSDRTEILNTQVRLSPGRTVLIGGPKHGQGVAILALSASF